MPAMAIEEMRPAKWASGRFFNGRNATRSMSSPSSAPSTNTTGRATQIDSPDSSTSPMPTNADTAKAALPKLQAFSPTLEAIEKGSAALPEAEKATIADLVAEKLGPLQKLIDTVMAIPGVKEILGKVVTPMVESLVKLGR